MLKSSIRLLKNTDVQLLANLHFPWSSYEETELLWERYLEEQEKGIRLAFILEQGSEIQGYAHLLFHSDYFNFREKKVPEIQNLWIFESCRRQGLATKLMHHLEHSAKDLNYSEIGIGVGLYKDYGAAQRLYVHLGYQPDGRGITYQYKEVSAGASYAIDDDLILWLTKHL